jgi:GNAT superfamily N-acetyltransferase
MNWKLTKELTQREKLEIIKLWNQEYPRAMAHAEFSDFEKYLQGLAEVHHILLFEEEEHVLGWLIYFLRDNEQGFALLLDSSLQGKGWGSKILDRAKELNSELNGWVVDHEGELKQNGKPYRSPTEFYRRNGFEIRQDIQRTMKDVSCIKVIWKSNSG